MIIRNMLKRFLILAIVVLLAGSSYSQFDTLFAKTNIRHCADSMAMGFRTKNWDQYVRYLYPAVIGTMGGKAEVVRIMSMSFAGVPDTAWKEYRPGKILQVIKTAGDLQAVIELRSILEWQGQRITTTSHLVGESWDGGLFWTFFDSEGDMNAAKSLKPDLSDLIVIPQKKETVEPIFIVPKKN